jgi:hypothetical protein
MQFNTTPEAGLVHESWIFLEVLRALEMDVPLANHVGR